MAEALSPMRRPLLIAGALKRPPPGELDRVEDLFVSVDPQRDDSQDLAEHTSYFHPRIRDLAGPAEQVAEVARRYGAAFGRAEQAGSATGYMVDHSSLTYLVGPRGHLVVSLGHGTPPEGIIAPIRSILVDG
jgi:protein SCO1